MTDTGREPLAGSHPIMDDLEAQAADDFYHDRPAADSAQVYDSRPESRPVGDLAPGGTSSSRSALHQAPR